MSRFSKTDWLDLGVHMLSEEGPEALSLERLTRAAGMTRGSFYHHFIGREAFLTAMMSRWRATAIEGNAQRYRADTSPAAWRELMRQAPFEMDSRFERAVRRLAVVEPVVAQAVALIDGERIAGITFVISQLQPNIADPQALAFIQYAAVVGGQWLAESADEALIVRVRKVGATLFGIDEPTA